LDIVLNYHDGKVYKVRKIWKFQLLKEINLVIKVKILFINREKYVLCINKPMAPTILERGLPICGLRPNHVCKVSR
jgi:hypothetical protein